MDALVEGAGVAVVAASGTGSGRCAPPHKHASPFTTNNTQSTAPNDSFEAEAATRLAILISLEYVLRPRAVKLD